MADVKWIKIVTDVFDDEKMLLIDGLPERDGIIVIWFKMLCMAGKNNNGGVFMLNDKIAYTDEMLAQIFRRPLNTIRLALKTFEDFGMIEIINNTITIPNWDKHQSLDKLEKAREKNRLRVAAHRERQKALAESNANSNVTVTQSNETDKIREEKEEDKEVDIENKPKRKRSESNRPPKKDLEAEFETIWALYPNKKGKDKALGYYIKARENGESYDSIREGVIAYSKECEIKGTEKRFIQHGSTWFNNGGWKDEYDLTPAPQQKNYGANGIAIDQNAPNDLAGIF